MHKGRLPCLLLTALVSGACWRSVPAPRAFEVARTSPALGNDAEPLLLNDTLTVYFSDPVQPLSVTEESVTLVDEDGHRVPGELRVSANWVTFHPEPPLSRDLGDGSFRPGGIYKLLLAGSPRPDAVCAADGRRLQAARVFDVRIADRLYRRPGLASPLRPPSTEIPFLLRPQEVPQVLPADAPRMRLHFTLPVLPTSISEESFTVRFGQRSERVLPRSVRVVKSRLDELPGRFPGSTVEIDLGSVLRLENGGGTAALGEGDWISVELAVGGSITDYAGNSPLPSASPHYWSVVKGSSVTLAEWPAPGETSFVDDDGLAPGFEVRAGAIRPRVRVEAGDGSLGVFRPQRDTVLRPGVAFDRGDGREVVSRDGMFPFLAIDIPVGVTVVVDGSTGPVRLLSCGGVRIHGVLELAGPSGPLHARPFETVAVSELAAAANVTLLAAGDVYLAGAVRTRSPSPADGSPWTLAAAGRMHLHGDLPYNTILVIEAPQAEQAPPAITGARGQAVVVGATFTYGLAAGAEFTVRGFTAWRQLPLDRDGGSAVLVEAEDPLQVAWQVAAPDPVRPTEPDLRGGLSARPLRLADRDVVAVAPGGFVRLQFEAPVAAGGSLPGLREVRILDR